MEGFFILYFFIGAIFLVFFVGVSIEGYFTLIKWCLFNKDHRKESAVMLLISAALIGLIYAFLKYHWVNGRLKFNDTFIDIMGIIVCIILAIIVFWDIPYETCEIKEKGERLHKALGLKK